MCVCVCLIFLHFSCMVLGEESSAEISRKVALVLLPLLSLPGVRHIPVHQLMLVGTDTKQSEFESKIIPSEGAVSHPSLFSFSQSSYSSCRQCSFWCCCQKSLRSLIIDLQKLLFDCKMSNTHQQAVACLQWSALWLGAPFMPAMVLKWYHWIKKKGNGMVME